MTTKHDDIDEMRRHMAAVDAGTESAGKRFLWLAGKSAKNFLAGLAAVLLMPLLLIAFWLFIGWAMLVYVLTGRDIFKGGRDNSTFFERLGFGKNSPDK